MGEEEVISSGDDCPFPAGHILLGGHTPSLASAGQPHEAAPWPCRPAKAGTTAHTAPGPRLCGLRTGTPAGRGGVARAPHRPGPDLNSYKRQQENPAATASRGILGKRCLNTPRPARPQIFQEDDVTDLPHDKALNLPRLWTGLHSCQTVPSCASQKVHRCHGRFIAKKTLVSGGRYRSPGSAESGPCRGPQRAERLSSPWPLTGWW